MCRDPFHNSIVIIGQEETFVTLQVIVCPYLNLNIIFLLAAQILNPQANRTLRERRGEKNTFDH